MAEEIELASDFVIRTELTKARMVSAWNSGGGNDGSGAGTAAAKQVEQVIKRESNDIGEKSRKGSL